MSGLGDQGDLWSFCGSGSCLSKRANQARIAGMQFNIPLESASCVALAMLLVSIAALLALWNAPLRALSAASERQHLWFASTLALGLIWNWGPEVMPGVHVHLLLLLAYTAVFGWSLAIIGGMLASVAHWVYQGWPPGGLPLTLLFQVVVPATLSFGVVSWVLRLRTRNLFFYILGAGFFGAMAVRIVTAVLLGGYLAVFEWPLAEALWEHSSVYWLMVYSEGFLNGMLLTSITVFKPDLVKTFDDEKYLGKP